MKLVINKCYGGFSISREAAEFMAERGDARAKAELEKSTPKKFFGYGYVEDMDGTYERDNLLLVAAVEALGEKANGDCASLQVVEIPDGTKWQIEEYDGREWIAEAHQTWS